MPQFDCPCLSIAIARLMAYPATRAIDRPNPSAFNLHREDSAHFAIWVIRASYPGGYTHHDRLWPYSLSLAWQGWQDLFQMPSEPLHSPCIPAVSDGSEPSGNLAISAEEKLSYSSRLMQQLGIYLWQWVFDGSIHSSLSQSQGMALGKNQPLRVRLEVRDPHLIALPWEIMQPQPGKPAISISPTLLFSRTTCDVEPLAPQRSDRELNILLVLGQTLAAEDGVSQSSDNSSGNNSGNNSGGLELETEAKTLARILEDASNPNATLPSMMSPSVPCHVDTLIQPTAAQLIAALERKAYNVVFYAGHGVPSPDGGLLYLGPQTTLSGTEFANVLVRAQVTLAVFNTCWSAKPDIELKWQGSEEIYHPIPGSSLAEVLLHHGVPAVLGMREAIADEEALSFIEAFAEALGKCLPIDEAVAVARQRLVTLYKYNQPAWTLPVLYMHPEFDGQLLTPPPEGVTEFPDTAATVPSQTTVVASLRSLVETTQVWQIRGGLMRVGRREGNDLVISERWVSQRHAEIIRREPLEGEPTYWLRDFSRFGTLVLRGEHWQKIHHQEMPLKSGEKIKFGSSQGQILEFAIEEIVEPSRSSATN
ncbi:CHAT domain-containing protein [Roseofilum casamattae]|uniref:CHAT domain-containing protein n=1 Tax=Roseofilum casamattae BLCC-M143 TaxID=3022442 RepID=A0ABT7BVD6_9CYAN|nr:CHAT domain-containing protein [Roseofilum casamattae]MDJ1182421.1 CHAT domain-containing protein [Roseofilum casamattae BLCC-M143]